MTDVKFLGKRTRKALQHAKAVVDGVRGVNPGLERRFDAVAAETVQE